MRATREHRKQRRQDGNGPWLPENTRKRNEKMWAAVACFSAKQGLVFIVRVRVRIDTMYATQGEREMRGKGGAKSKMRVQPATDRVASYAKGGPVFRKKHQVYCISKCDSEHEVERSGGGRSPMAKEARGRLKKRATSLR